MVEKDHVVGSSIFENRTGRQDYGGGRGRDTSRRFSETPRDPVTLSQPGRNRPLTDRELKANARSV